MAFAYDGHGGWLLLMTVTDSRADIFVRVFPTGFTHPPPALAFITRSSLPGVSPVLGCGLRRM